eukprot:TRINITY_DN8801_c0_g1_i3.p2 TRINITY_DN8801_c0_g1~~TRINITY_DN8801_c0_g1_i3.p2  ORF type:complete len:110 (+),score=21.23 TRINITY_DN8801_c0_g1_i3:19-348(+)
MYSALIPQSTWVKKKIPEISQTFGMCGGKGMCGMCGVKVKSHIALVKKVEDCDSCAGCGNKHMCGSRGQPQNAMPSPPVPKDQVLSCNIVMKKELDGINIEIPLMHQNL